MQAISTTQVLALAVKHLSNESSRLCLADARVCEERGDIEHARTRALASLRHSIGILHQDYKRAAR